MSLYGVLSGLVTQNDKKEFCTDYDVKVGELSALILAVAPFEEICNDEAAAPLPMDVNNENESEREL